MDRNSLKLVSLIGGAEAPSIRELARATIQPKSHSPGFFLKKSMSSKPLFTWVPAPDGRQRSNQELVNHCVTVQEFFMLLREQRMDRDLVQRDYAKLLMDMKSTLQDNGIRVIEPQWFASLLW